MKTAKCEERGKPFKPVRHQRFCGVNCRVKAYHHRQAAFAPS
jgi:hypothetical protein